MSLPTPQEERYYETLRQTRRERYARENANLIDFPEVVFIGDSITEFFDLDKYLKSPVLMVNRGISASRTDHILDHLDCHLSGPLLNKIFLMIGVNDLGYGISQEATLTNLRAIIDGILSSYPFSTIYLLGILPVNESKSFAKTVGLRTNQAIQTLNKSYQAMADDYVNVTYLPTYEAFLDDSGQLSEDLTVDGLHLSPKGYECLAEVVQGWLL